MGFESIILILKNLLVLIMVIVLVNLLLRYVNKYMTKNNNIIRIIERLSTNKDSSLCVVMICNKYYLMSFTKEGHNILKDLQEEEVEEILREKSEENLNKNIKWDLDYVRGLGKKLKVYVEMGKKLE